jgi:hypothetical protein
VILPYSDKRRLDEVERRLRDVQRAQRSDPSLQVLPDGTLLMPRGVTIGGGGAGTPVFTPDVVPPPTALALTPGASSDEVWLDVAWTAPAGLGADQVTSYQVRHRHDALPWTSTTTTSTEVRLIGLIPAVLYDVEVIALTRLGKASVALAGSETTLRDSIPPAQVLGVQASSAIETVFLEWDPVADRDVPAGGRYESQVATDNAFTTVVADVSTGGSATHVVIPGMTPDVQVWARVRAVDASGNAGPWSATVTTTPGAVPASPTDGSPPATSPAVGSVVGGVGFLLARWTEVANTDPVTYDVHVGAVSGFAPAATNLVGSVAGTAMFVRALADGTPLAYGTTYYVRLVARDDDGAAPAGLEGSGQMAKATTVDIAAGTVTAASAIIADATIGEALIIDAAITTAKISDLAVTTAKIANLAVDRAKIADLAVDTAKIADLAVGSAKISDLSASKITAGTLTADVTLSSLISTAASGARVELRPSGIFGYGTDGVTPNLEYRTIDGKVTVRGTVDASTITGSTIEGSTLQTGPSGARVVIDSTGLVAYGTDGVAEKLRYKSADGTLVVRGLIEASTIEGSVIRTALSGQRIVIDAASADTIRFLSPENVAARIVGYRINATQSGVAMNSSETATAIECGPGQIVARSSGSITLDGNVGALKTLNVGTQLDVGGRAFIENRLQVKGHPTAQYFDQVGFVWAKTGHAGIGFYHEAGVAAAIFKSFANLFECRNSGDSGFVDIRASAFVVNSARADKLDVTATDRRALAARARALDVVTFRRPPPPPLVGPDGEEVEPDHTMAAYVARRADRALPGLVADDLAATMPEVVDFGPDGEVVGYDLSAVVAEVLAYAQDIEASLGAALDRIADLEATLG